MEMAEAARQPCASSTACAGGGRSTRLNLDEIRAIAFHGTAQCSRPVLWRLLLGVMAVDAAEWPALLEQKRAQYRTWTLEFSPRPAAVSAGDSALWREIEKVRVPNYR